MFTGLIEEIGEVAAVAHGSKSSRITVKAQKVLEDVKLGDSICTNGACLTVTAFGKGSFTVDVMAETMRRSNLSGLAKGSRVNLERALRVGDRLGGHMVSGHIDGVGTLAALDREDNAVWMTVSATGSLLKYIIEKGSIAIDGVSLTVAYVDDKVFKVSIIPHTKDATTLLGKKPGEQVNLECDMVGKYIEKLLAYGGEEKKTKDIDMGFLARNGFL